jgi:hypothetical protein
MIDQGILKRFEPACFGAGEAVTFSAEEVPLHIVGDDFAMEYTDHVFDSWFVHDSGHIGNVNFRPFMSVKKSQRTLEELRLKYFGENLLNAWTTAHNAASHEAFTSNEGFLPTDALHFSMFSSIAAEELDFLLAGLSERFPQPKHALLKKCCLASVAAIIAQTLVKERAV